MASKRHRKSWTVNECLKLEREYDLLKLSITDIAIKRVRTPRAIMTKLDIVGIASYSDLYLQMPELMPLKNHQKSHVNNTYIAENIHNETCTRNSTFIGYAKKYY